LESGPDEVDDVVGLLEHELVGNAQHGNAAAAKEGVAQSILALSTQMRIAVKLNGEARKRAEKVSEVGPDGKLSPETETVDLPPPKQVPEPLLGNGGTMTMLACQRNTAEKSSFHIDISTRWISSCAGSTQIEEIVGWAP